MKNIKKLKLSNQKKIHKLRLKCFGFLPSLDSLKNNNVIIEKKTQTQVEMFWIFASPDSLKKNLML